MITRGIIEKSIDPYHVKVRIPSIDRVTSSSVHTTTDNLNTAIYATLPGCEVQLAPGDVVIVAMDDSDDTVTILGYLYREASTKKDCKFNLQELNVNSAAKLPSDTCIGDVTPKELSYLSGLTKHVQYQLNELERRIKLLEGQS